MATAPAEFFVDYDDFSGGLFVGSNDAKMPKDTFVGDNMITCEVDGMLMPAAAWVPRSDAGAGAALGANGVAIALTDSGFSYLVSTEAGGGHLIAEAIDENVANHPWNAGSRGVTTTSLSDDRGFARMGPFVVWFANQTPPVAARYNELTAGINATTIPTTLAFPTTFGQFVVGANGNSIFWCNPGDPATWPAANFLTFGSNAYSITTMLVVGQSLLVGRPDGWWQITGVLGANETVIQIATEGPSGYAAIAADTSLMFPGRLFDGSAVRVLRGSISSTVAYQESPVPTYNAIYSAGGYLLGVGTSGEIVGRSPTGRWFHLNTAHQNSNAIVAFANGPATHPYAYAYLLVGSTRTPYRMLLAPVNPPMTAPGTGFVSATATLADYKRTTRFRIKSVVAELDLGVTSIDAQRSISVRMQTPGQIVEGSLSATEFSAAGSTTQTIVLPAVATTAGERVTVRFSPCDGQDTYSMIPEITLQGCKLRRLLVRCTEVGS